MAGMNLTNVPHDNPAYVEFVKVHMENALGAEILNARLSDLTGDQIQRVRRVREAAHKAWFEQMSVQPTWATLNELDRLLGYVPITDEMDVEFVFDGANANAGDLIPAR